MVLTVHKHWQKNVYFETRRSWPPRGDGIFAGWDNVRVISFSPVDHDSYQVLIPSCLASCDVSSILSVSSPSVLTCYRDYVLHSLLLRFSVV